MKEINGMELKEWMDIERESRDALIIGKKMVLASELMLRNAERIIKELGGEINEERVKRVAKEAKEMKEKTA